MQYYIKNATVVNAGKTFKASVLVKDGFIDRIIGENEVFDSGLATQVDAEGKYLIPGIIDEHVHFREPGLVHKADIYTESCAAVAGGVTSYMEMPNTIPQTVTQDLLQQKYDLAAEKSLANYSFYIGATNDNIAEIVKSDPKRVCGVKLFMGSSTGNMLVDKKPILEKLFHESPCLIAAHCEDEDIIRNNTSYYKNLVEKGKMVPDASLHPLIRTSEACYKSSAKAVEMAEKAGTRLHVLHVSTEKELSLFRNDISLEDKKITAETCPHYLYFSDKSYMEKGFAVKCNPAIKTDNDSKMLLAAMINGLIDTIGTDHAPHLLAEKFTNDYFTSKSGFPSIQHSLELMANMAYKGSIGITDMVRLMCHNPAVLYQIDRRGFVREGYHADLVLLDMDMNTTIGQDEEYTKCGWTPYEGLNVHVKVTHTFVNGNLVYQNGIFDDKCRGERLLFDR